MAEPTPDRNGRPWIAKMAGGILSERGLGTLLSLVLVLGILWFGIRFVNDMQTFQTLMIAESARTNERLTLIELRQLELKVQMDCIERLLIAELGKTP